MSYDLIVFELSAAPREPSAFLDWCNPKAEWSEGHSYNAPAVTTPKLSAWFSEMRRDFPHMTGPDAYKLADDEDNLRGSDHAIGRSVLYASFAWSVAETAHAVVLALAVKHGVAYFDPGVDGELWSPPTDRMPDL